MEDTSKKISALAMGAAHLPLDIAKYSGMVWNATSNLPEDEIIRRNRQLADYFDNVKFLPEEVQKYHNWVRSENPGVTKAGEVGLATILAGPARGVSMPAYSLLKRSPAVQSVDKLGRYLKRVIPVAAGTTAVKASEEYVAEPILDKQLTNNDNNVVMAINNILNQNK